MAKKTYYFDMDGVLANFHKEPYKYTNAINREWIANLEPFVENVALINQMIAEHKTVYILSKCASEEAKLGKIDWLKKYVPALDEKHIIIIVRNGKKIDYIKTKTAVMIDDDMKNIKPFIEKGFDYYFVENKGDKIIL